MLRLLFYALFDDRGDETSFDDVRGLVRDLIQADRVEVQKQADRVEQVPDGPEEILNDLAENPESSYRRPPQTSSNYPLKAFLRETADPETVCTNEYLLFYLLLCYYEEQHRFRGDALTIDHGIEILKGAKAQAGAMLAEMQAAKAEHG